MPTIKVNDIDMYYEQHGQGEDLLLITGLNCSHLMWTNVLPLLTPHYRVTFIDNRGAGKTSVPAGPYSTEQMADDTAAFMDAIGLENAHVVGHSMGGAIAQHLGIKYPKKVNKLVLYATASKFDPRCNFILEQQLDLYERNASPIEMANYIGLPWCFSMQFLAEPKNIENFHALALDNPYPMTLEGTKAQTAAVVGHDTQKDLSKINAWTLVISPEQDLLTPPADGEFMAARIPNARFIEIANYSHCWHLEAPQQFVEQVHLYLQREKV